jgi:antitoxin HigA-1
MAIIHNPLHPGFIVKDELIDATGMNVTEAADRLGVSRTALSRLLNGHAGISPEMALRLSKFFKTSIEMWINLQAQYDTWLIAKQSKKIKVKPFDFDKAA